MKRFPFFFVIFLILLAESAGLFPRTCFAQDETDTGSRKVLSRTMPAYPQVARSMSLRGAVRLEVLVQPNGIVKTVQVKGGNPLLVQSAENAIHAWKWEKADRESTEKVEFHFNP